MKFAVIETGGKQYLVKEGDTITVEKLAVGKGGVIKFEKVLLVHDGKETKLGFPYLEGVAVEGEFVEEGKGKKILVMKYRPKSRYKKVRGHRQPYTKVTIKTI